MQAVPPNAAEAEGGEAAYERRENGVMLFHPTHHRVGRRPTRGGRMGSMLFHPTTSG